MASSSFSVASIHNVAALSCCSWFLITLLAHVITSRLWHGYGKLKPRHKLAWCNRIASATHAAVLVAGQASNLSDPALNADPLFAVTDSHFMWGSVMYGYLIYDTIFTLVFYNAVGTVAFLLHHCLGLTCCCFGLYFNKMALFGTAIEVFFEGTTPLLHLMGCLKLMGQEGTPSYTAIGMTFVTQFFVCRVVIANYYWSRMISAVAALDNKPAWALGGIAVYGILSGLNMFWFYKLMQLALQAGSQKQISTFSSATQPSPTAAAAVDITAASGQAAAAASSAVSSVSSPTKSKPLRQRSKQMLTDWLESSKQKAAAVSQFKSSTLPGLQSRLSECLDAADSPKIAASHAAGRGLSGFGPAVVDCWDRRSSPVAGSQGGRLPESQMQGGRSPVSPFAAMADQNWPQQHTAASVEADACGARPALQADWERFSWTTDSQSSGTSLAKAVLSEFGPAVLAQWEMHQALSAEGAQLRGSAGMSGVSASMSGLGPAVLAGLDDYRSPSPLSGHARTEGTGGAVSAFGPAFLDEWDARMSLQLDASCSGSMVGSLGSIGSNFGPAAVDEWNARRSLDTSPLRPRAAVKRLKVAGLEFGPAVLAGLEHRQSPRSMSPEPRHIKVC